MSRPPDDSSVASPKSGGTTLLPLPPELLQRGRCPFDPPEALDRMRQQSTVSLVELLNGATVWMVTDFDQARAVLSDPRFSSDLLRRSSIFSDMPDEVREQLLDERLRAGSFIGMDPPEHSRYRKLLTGEFTVRRMRLLAPRILAIVTEHIDAMVAAGTSADLVQAFALPVPSLVICELLGVPYADRREFQQRTALLLRLDTAVEELLRISEEMRQFMLRLVTDKRDQPTDDLLSGLIHGDADPALTDDELVNIALLLLVAGHETTANMLGLGTFALLEHPDQLDALRADPSLIDGAVEELLRYLSIVHVGLMRVAVEPVELDGQEIPAGATVLVSVPETNRDPEHWADPGSLDVTRVRSPHLAFGHGVHQCLGQQLARVEMTVGFTELLRRLPGLRLAVPPQDVPLRSDMAIFGVHALPVRWDEPESPR
ncbi:MAG TPA: cytochrome P450 [Mycobacteriales bacterium]|nr:cytochrome P450 [Mycobacteriales bacterium]